MRFNEVGQVLRDELIYNTTTVSEDRNTKTCHYYIKIFVFLLCSQVHQSPSPQYLMKQRTGRCCSVKFEELLQNLKWSGRTALETSFLLRSLRSQREEVVTTLPSTPLWPRLDATAVKSLRGKLTIGLVLRLSCLSVVRFVSWCFTHKIVHVLLV